MTMLCINDLNCTGGFPECVLTLLVGVMAILACVIAVFIPLYAWYRDHKGKEMFGVIGKALTITFFAAMLAVIVFTWASGKFACMDKINKRANDKDQDAIMASESPAGQASAYLNPFANLSDAQVDSLIERAWEEIQRSELLGKTPDPKNVISGGAEIGLGATR